MRDALAPPRIRPWVPDSHSFVPSMVTIDFDRAKASGQSSVPAPVTSSCTAMPATRKHPGDIRWLTGVALDGPFPRPQSSEDAHPRWRTRAPWPASAACGLRGPVAGGPLTRVLSRGSGFSSCGAGLHETVSKVSVRETSRRSCRAACRLCPGGCGLLALWPEQSEGPSPFQGVRVSHELCPGEGVARFHRRASPPLPLQQTSFKAFGMSCPPLGPPPRPLLGSQGLSWVFLPAWALLGALSRAPFASACLREGSLGPLTYRGL